MAQYEKEAQEKCGECGASLRARWEPLSSGLVRCLIKALQAVKASNENRFHWHRDLRLSNNESHNFQKLRFHGLIAHADPSNKKSGEWLITRRGGDFLRGEVAVPKKVLVFRNTVRDHSAETVNIAAFKGAVPEFEREFDYVAFTEDPQ